MLPITRSRAKGRFRCRQLPLPYFTLAKGVSFTSFSTLSTLSIRVALIANYIVFAVGSTLAAVSFWGAIFVANYINRTEAFAALGFVGAFTLYRLSPWNRAAFFLAVRLALRFKAYQMLLYRS